MKNAFILILSGILCGACSDEPKTQKASVDLVTNPVTANDTSVAETEMKEISAAISFEKTEHDFGSITQGEKAEYRFKFTNTGNQDLLITSANASCGCTVPEYSKEPIKPGAIGYIKVKFNSEYRLDAFEKSVTVTANTVPMETELRIKGFINPNPGASKTQSPF